jgi:hypothetical protein
VAEWVEISTLDMRYEGYRVRDPHFEEALLCSIRLRGIETPLSGMDIAGRQVLLDGFKRCRCARKLEIPMVPYEVIADDERTGLLHLLKPRKKRRSCALEEAGFVRLLIEECGMSDAEVACALGRSRGWVSMRTRMLLEITEGVAREVYRGRFPAYSYTYVLRRFIRMNGVDAEAIESFVRAVSGRGLTHRQIERLGHAWFEGPVAMRGEIEAGNLSFVLGCMERAVADGTSERERSCLSGMQRVLDGFGHLETMSRVGSLSSPSFRAQAHILLTKILARVGAFVHAMRRFHDRCGEEEERVPAAPERHGKAGDCAAPGAGSEDGAGDHQSRRRSPEDEAERPDRDPGG